MKINYLKICVLIFFQISCVANTLHSALNRVAIFDTMSREEFQYRPFIEILKSINCKVDYNSIEKIMATNPKKINLNQHNAAFFIFGLEFLKTMDTSSVSAKILKIMELYGYKKDMVIGIFFPPLRKQEGLNAIAIFAPIFHRLGLTTMSISQTPENTRSNINLFLHVTNNFLLMPVESRPLKYHTTLSLPRDGTPFDTSQMLSSGQANLKFLPTNAKCSAVISATLPYGIYWYNPICNNHVFLAQNTLLSFSGISENFHFCPAKFALREEINAAIQQTFWELFQVKSGKSLETQKPDLPRQLKAFGAPIKSRQNQTGRKIGWMEINVFKEDKKEAKSQLIDYVFDSGVDTLWISFNPQEYFSKLAKYPRKNKKPSEQEITFLKSVSLFTKVLKTRSKELKKPIPNILVGIEIANNLYPPNMPKNFARDLYGNNYEDLPAPLNKGFWQSEVKDSLDEFLKQWRKPKIGHDVKIAGVVLDLEMYCRKITGSFSDAMGFEPLTCKRFIKQPRSQNLNSANKIALFLSERGLAKKYYSFLETEAIKLGTELKQHFNKKIPRSLIMCYTPNIATSWFYKGLFRGLSQKNKPLALLTFNSEFAWHESWLKKNKIYLEHSSVLMLSKIKNENDFAWVEKILTTNNSIWLNRFSRFVEKYDPTSWIAIEQTPISDPTKIDFFEHLRNAN